MEYRPESPRRRHILSSINPEPAPSRTRRRSASPAASAQLLGEDAAAPERDSTQRRRRDDRNLKDEGLDHDDQNRPRRSRLKLKDPDKSSRKRRSSNTRHRHRHRYDYDDHRREENRDVTDTEFGGSHKNGEHGERHQDHSRRRREERRERRRREEKQQQRSPTPPNPYDPDPMDPEAAFRASLFDAMADDEGADYWAAVYGQPVHVYADDRERTGPQGELERMTDEEYAAHVRQKMWEKTHAGLLEERARREEAKKRKEQEDKRSRILQREMEESLRKGDERRKRKMWERRWDEYCAAWAAGRENSSSTNLTWPVESGRREDLDEKSVRAFFAYGLDLGGAMGETEFVAKMKEERVRWHPDKVQQRLGGKVDEDTMKDVTAIFQIIDRLWNEMRKT